MHKPGIYYIVASLLSRKSFRSVFRRASSLNFLRAMIQVSPIRGQASIVGHNLIMTFRDDKQQQ